MGRKCIVPFCRSGYNPLKNEKVQKGPKPSIFSVPKSDEMLKKWRKAIPRKDYVLKIGDGVCEKHFLPSDIVRMRVVRDPLGNIMASENLCKPSLKSDSVPSIFPKGPNEPVKIPPKGRRLLKRLRESPKKSSSENTKRTKNTGTLLNSNTPKDDQIPSDLYNSIKKEIVEGEKEKRLELFDSLYKERKNVNLPLQWFRRKNSSGDFNALEFSQPIVKKLKDSIIFASSKQLVIYEDMRLFAEVMGRKFNLRKIDFTSNYASTLEELENLIIKFNSVKVCPGISSADLDEKADTSSTFLDIFHCLRHKNCSLLLTNDPGRSCCNACRSLKKINKVIRLKNHTGVKITILKSEF